jgi:hypothetical protein
MVTWDIRGDGRAWGNEAMSRYQMTPEKSINSDDSRRPGLAALTAFRRMIET